LAQTPRVKGFEFNALDLKLYMGKFKKGLFLGGLVGAMLMWMQTTKEGRETRKKLQDWAQEAFDELKEKASESDLADRVKYNKHVQRVVGEYSKRKGVPVKAVKHIEKILKAQWKRLRSK